MNAFSSKNLACLCRLMGKLGHVSAWVQSLPWAINSSSLPSTSFVDGGVEGTNHLIMVSVGDVTGRNVETFPAMHRVNKGQTSLFRRFRTVLRVELLTVKHSTGALINTQESLRAQFQFIFPPTDGCSMQKRARQDFGTLHCQFCRDLKMKKNSHAFTVLFSS